MTGAAAARGKAAFIRQLHEHYRQCGIESAQQIVALSHEVSIRYPSRAAFSPARHKPETDLVTLSKTAISDVLGGRMRKNLPSWPWTATFVLCCTGWAYDNNVMTGADPGRDALPGWARRRWLAESAERRGGITLPAGVQAFLAGHGPYGKSLAAEVAAGAPEAIYRAAVLLGTDPAHADEALALLLWDIATLHPVTGSLATASPGALDPQTAARCARLFARAARSSDEAAAFRQAADRAPENPAHRVPRRVPPQSGVRPATAPAPPGRRRPPSGNSPAAGNSTPG
jgi:hypothetical protein